MDELVPFLLSAFLGHAEIPMNYPLYFQLSGKSHLHMSGKSHPVNVVGQNPGLSETTEHVNTDLEDYRKPVQPALLISAPLK